eukprot:2399-Heterococcus_DN1.PRE.7
MIITAAPLCSAPLQQLSSMAQKKAQRKQETTLMPHRTPNLTAFLERAKTGESAQALKAYLDAGGSPMAVLEVSVRGGGSVLQKLPLLH